MTLTDRSESTSALCLYLDSPMSRPRWNLQMLFVHLLCCFWKQICGINLNMAQYYKTQLSLWDFVDSDLFWACQWVQQLSRRQIQKGPIIRLCLSGYVFVLDRSKVICPYDSLISCGDELLAAVFFLPIPDRGCICLFHTIKSCVPSNLFKDSCRYWLAVFVVILIVM